jgi:multidrug efflux pump subunit AcrB
MRSHHYGNGRFLDAPFIRANLKGDVCVLRLLPGFPAVPHDLALSIYADGDAKAIRTDWRDPVMVVRPVLAEAEANLAGVTREDVATTIRVGFEGERSGVYREGDELLPIVIRAAQSERGNVASVANLQVWSLAAQQFVPLRQVVSSFETVFQDPIIQRLNRVPTITVHADPVSGQASELLARIRPKVEALDLGPDYELQWWGEYKSSKEGQEGIAASAPFFFLSMVLIVIALFDALRQPLIIWLTVPLALIGITVGLLLGCIAPISFAVLAYLPVPA